MQQSEYPENRGANVELGARQQVTGRAGDLLLAHYLLGHNKAGNTSTTTREVVVLPLALQGPPRSLARIRAGRIIRTRTLLLIPPVRFLDLSDLAPEKRRSQGD